MTKQIDSLLNIFNGWNGYNQSLVNAVMPLTPEQLNWRPEEKFNSMGELVRHISLGRLTWLSRIEAPGSKELANTISEMVQDSDGNNNIVESSITISEQPAELVRWLNLTWEIIENSLTSWSLSDFFQTFPHQWNGDVYAISRQWTMWRVMNHDIHHGGELSLMLGLQGIEAFELCDLFGHTILPPLHKKSRDKQ
jgi:uncharacterized damage-inducible protein DinB